MHIFVKTVYFYRGKGAGFFVYSVLTKNVLCRSNYKLLHFYGAQLVLLRTFCLRGKSGRTVERKYYEKNQNCTVVSPRRSNNCYIACMRNCDGRRDIKKAFCSNKL